MLSRVTDKGKLGVYQLLLEIASNLEALASDPKELKKTIDETYQLSEAEAEKAASAKENIAVNEALLSQLRKKQAEIDSEFNDLEKERASVKNIVDSLKNEQVRLQGIEQQLGKRALDLDTFEKSLIERERTSAKCLVDIESRNKDLNSRQSDILAGEAMLKEKMDKLRGIVDA